MLDRRLLLVLLYLSSCVTVFGCRATVTNLHGEVPMRHPTESESYPFTLRVDRLTEGEGGDVRGRPDAAIGLLRAIRDLRLFSSVELSDASSDETDFVLRGDIETRWGSQGAKNFFTYFPGGLVFAPSWRGVRWELDSRLVVELVDNRSGAVVGEYEVESAYEMVHTSGNPMHFFGAALVVPATIVGSRKARVNDVIRSRVYSVAFPEIFRQAADQLDLDRRPVFRAEIEERIERCGDDYAAPPHVGGGWEAFRACQPHYFSKRGEYETEAGTETVYDDAKGLWRVYVVDGLIGHWVKQTASRENCGARYAASPVLGEDWDRFRLCQPQQFSIVETRPAESGELQVFEDAAGTWRIEVLDGLIHQWSAQ